MRTASTDAPRRPIQRPRQRLRLSSIYALKCMVQGLRDALKWPLAILFLLREPVARSATVRCLLLNGFIFLGSLLLFGYIVQVRSGTYCSCHCRCCICCCWRSWRWRAMLSFDRVHCPRRLLPLRLHVVCIDGCCNVGRALLRTAVRRSRSRAHLVTAVLPRSPANRPRQPLLLYLLRATRAFDAHADMFVSTTFTVAVRRRLRRRDRCCRPR